MCSTGLRVSGKTTFQGNPLTLVGTTVDVGDKAPDFTVVDANLVPVLFSSFAGSIRIISSVPSLDTPVCSMQTQRFNKEASAFGNRVTILTISMDLPFAQARWCGAEGVKNVRVFSDHKEASFGASYGLLIQELRLLARAVIVVDTDGVIRYKQLVEEMTNEVDYEAALAAVKKLV